MAGTCLEKIKHEGCVNESNNALQVFDKDDGTVDGWCFSCGEYVRHPYGDEKQASDLPKPKKKTEKEIQAELAFIDGLPSLSIPSRKLRGDTLADFDVKIGVSEQDGKTPAVAFYPYTKNGRITGYKVKTLGEFKKTWSIGDLKDVDPFGWHQAISSGARKVIIVEGEEDALAFTQIIRRCAKKEYQDYMTVISLQHGVGTISKRFSKDVPELRRYFQDFILCFDNDEPGREATHKAHKMLPEAKTVTLPYKDANECLVKGAREAAYKAVSFKTQNVKNTRLINANTLFETAMIPAQYGALTYPFPVLNDVTRGVRYGETIYIGAGAKMGKSELVDAIAAHFMTEHNVSVLMCKPEQANSMTMKKVAGKIAGAVFHDPKVPFDKDKYKAACKVVDDKLILLDLYQHVGWDTLKLDIEQAAHEGVKAVFIDPITNLTNGMNSADANVKLQSIAQELSAMALDLDIVVFIFCHLKAPEGNIGFETRNRHYGKGEFIGLGNCPHELGGDVTSAQFAGSRAMMRSCNYMIGLEGNKDVNVPEEMQDIRNLKLLEDREFGETLVLPLHWNRNTTRFEEAVYKRK